MLKIQKMIKSCSKRVVAGRAIDPSLDRNCLNTMASHIGSVWERKKVGNLKTLKMKNPPNQPTLLLILHPRTYKLYFCKWHTRICDCVFCKQHFCKCPRWEISVTTCDALHNSSFSPRIIAVQKQSCQNGYKVH